MMKFLILALFPFVLAAQPKGTPRHSDAEAKAIIDSLYMRISTGEDFAKVARQYSEDPGSKEKGGLYVNVKEGAFTPEFESAVAQLQPSEISKPFKTQYGYHIAQLVTRQGNMYSVRHILIQCN